MNKIEKSINKHYESIMSDMNASARIIVDDSKEEKTYVTRIIDWNDRSISFHAPLVMGDYVHLFHDKTYTFVIVTKLCIYTTSVKIDKFTKNKKGHYYYKASLSSPLKREQQRMNFRLNWVLPFKFKVANKADEWKDANTLDISAGGLKIVSDEIVEANESIHIELKMYDEVLLLDGIILESHGKNPAGLYVYRVQFHELSRSTENTLAQLITRRQREMLRSQ